MQSAAGDDVTGGALFKSVIPSEARDLLSVVRGRTGPRGSQTKIPRFARDDTYHVSPGLLACAISVGTVLG